MSDMLIIKLIDVFMDQSCSWQLFSSLIHLKYFLCETLKRSETKMINTIKAVADWFVDWSVCVLELSGQFFRNTCLKCCCLITVVMNSGDCLVSTVYFYSLSIFQSSSCHLTRHSSSGILILWVRLFSAILLMLVALAETIFFTCGKSV